MGRISVDGVTRPRVLIILDAGDEHAVPGQVGVPSRLLAVLKHEELIFVGRGNPVARVACIERFQGIPCPFLIYFYRVVYQYCFYSTFETSLDHVENEDKADS